MYWITKDLGTASLPELETVEKLENVEVELVADLKDGKQLNKGQFESKVNHVEKIINKGNRAVIICVGGMSRSNAVALAYLVKSGMEFDKAYNLIKIKVPIARINTDLVDFVKGKYLKVGIKMKLTKDDIEDLKALLKDYLLIFKENKKHQKIL